MTIRCKTLPLIILIFFFFLVMLSHFFVINLSASMQRGLYVKFPIKTITRGSTIAFCLSEPYQSWGLIKQYIPRGNTCNGAIFLIKSVIARPGDTVILTNNYIEVNGIRSLYRTQYKDQHKRILKSYPRGVYVNTDGYWVIGINDLHSWDSRYFGPILKQQILYQLKLLLSW